MFFSGGGIWCYVVSSLWGAHVGDEAEHDAVLALLLVEDAAVLEVLHPLRDDHLRDAALGVLVFVVLDHTHVRHLARVKRHTHKNRGSLEG